MVLVNCMGRQKATVFTHKVTTLWSPFSIREACLWFDKKQVVTPSKVTCLNQPSEGAWVAHNIKFALTTTLMIQQSPHF